jgi:hypothetical protein
MRGSFAERWFAFPSGIGWLAFASRTPRISLQARASHKRHGTRVRHFRVTPRASQLFIERHVY